MKITIISGGSGNDRLFKGLKSLYKNCDIKVITNMYDSGKSTGICRKVTDTLGVSDVRKNHIRMYLAMTEFPNKAIVEFYNSRFNFSVGNEKEEILSLLDIWDLSKLGIYVERFFNRPESHSYKYDDFNIANIVYSEMYSEMGYEFTNSYFCDMLGIDDFVVINSFDNVYLNAITESGHVIEDEGDLVDWKNPNDKIVSITLDNPNSISLNQKAVDRIYESDLIIISTGTFWSSIYPTLYYGDFYRAINESSAKKIWAMNNEEDKDSYGVTSNDFISIVENLGLDLSSFSILENLDSKESLHIKNDSYNIVYSRMGNDNGKHNSELFSSEIFKIYYNLTDKYDNIIFDFDDTIWSRDYKNNIVNKNISINNVNIINDYLYSKSIIISGNTYKSLYTKLVSIYGLDLNGCKLDIWADSNCREYNNNKVVKTLKHLIIDNTFKNRIRSLLNDKFGIVCSFDNDEETFNIKIKPLNNLERNLMYYYMNDYYLNDSNYEARITGSTTIDIVNKNNNKIEVFKFLDLKGSSIYIGDEIDGGNDSDIAKLCTNSIRVKDVEETNTVLKLLRELYNE